MIAPPPPPAVHATTVDLGTLDDANAGRVAIMPTALTPPAGTFSFEDWELLMISASYAPSDNLVLSGTTMIPVAAGVYWGFFSAKLQVVKTGRLRMAVQGGLLAVSVKDTTTQFDSMGNIIGTMDTQNTTSGLELAGALTYCFDDNCFSHINAAAIAGFAYETQSSVPVGFMGGIVGRVGKHVRLLGEVDTGYSFGKIQGGANAFLGWYGVRFTSKEIGVDLALVKLFCDSCNSSNDPFPLGYPFVTFSYRAID
jgi:hypothetical protein